MRTDITRAEIQRLLKSIPFRPFSMNLENGDRLIIEHPENIAFDPDGNGDAGSPDFFVIADRLRMYGTFDAVTSVALVDEGQPSGK